MPYNNHYLVNILLAYLLILCRHIWWFHGGLINDMDILKTRGSRLCYKRLYLTQVAFKSQSPSQQHRQQHQIDGLMEQCPRIDL